jgi:cardiolipin synthase
MSRLWTFHYRNHRKIAVIDGKTGFLGSQNIGNEYLGWKNRNRSWRDILIRFEGPAVKELSSIFDDDWALSSRGSSARKSARRTAELTPETTDISLSILPTGPDETSHSLEMILCTLLAQAKKEVRVITPYFVPSLPLRLALAAAAHRGIVVKVLIPKASDQRFVDLAGRSVIPSLSKAGVEFLEFEQSFLHAKLILVDRELALIGSANMDERSFRLNWECSALISGTEAIAVIEASVTALLSASRPILKISNPSLLRRVLNGVLHLMFPLL